MTVPPSSGDPQDGAERPRSEPVELGKPAADEPFDPYRFGKPEHPVPPEYAPPGYTAAGYTPLPPETSPYAAGGPTGGPPPYPSGNPYPSGSSYPSGQYPSSHYSPPPYHGYPQPRTGNAKATTALVLGILSIVCFWLSIFDGILVVLALVFGILGLVESRAKGGSGRSLAIAGLVCVCVGAAAAMLWTAMLVHSVDRCGGLDDSNTNNSAFQQCVYDHLWFR